uniref:Cysteine protease n=1 Tax=Salix viminalis TaxID=40686 RepID=A0A6N2MRJ8_SALVM
MRPFYCERGFVASSKSSSTTDSPNRSFTSDSSELGSADTKFSKPSSWSTFFASAFSVFDTHRDSSSTSEKPHIRHGNGWTSAVKKLWQDRQDRNFYTPGDIWLLGACYKISQDNSSGDAAATNALAAFNHDFASRILITYRKGFDATEDSKLTSDVSWGCMLRSSQMLVAQACCCCCCCISHINTRFYDSSIISVNFPALGPCVFCCDACLPVNWLILISDSAGTAFSSIREILEKTIGQAYKCSTTSPGPKVYIFTRRINCPMYIPSLQATFTFPQSLGILGGKPGASTYIVGVQDENAFYLDPHEVQPVVNVSRDVVEANTSSYHCE